MNEIETIVGAKEDYAKLIYDARQKYKRDITEILLRVETELKGEDRTIMLQRCLDQMQMMECLAMQDQNATLVAIANSVNNHIKVGCMSETEYDRLQKKWEKNGFQSSDVKDFVLAVRKTFFDDSREEYQSFDCVNIRFSSFSGDEYSVDLTFRAGESLSSSREFDICLPVKGTVKCDSRAQAVRGRMSVKIHEHEEDELNKYSIRDDDKYIISSYKVEDVKERLAKYVLEDDKTEFDFDLVRNFLCKISGWRSSWEWNDSTYSVENGNMYRIYNPNLARFREAFGIDYDWA